jgi:hypothetical protein
MFGPNTPARIVLHSIYAESLYFLLVTLAL